jgi:hypothetical protein
VDLIEVYKWKVIFEEGSENRICFHWHAAVFDDWFKLGYHFGLAFQLPLEKTFVFLDLDTIHINIQLEDIVSLWDFLDHVSFPKSHDHYYQKRWNYACESVFIKWKKLFNAFFEELQRLKIWFKIELERIFINFRFFQLNL